MEDDIDTGCAGYLLSIKRLLSTLKMFDYEVNDMKIRERIDMYKEIFSDCKAIEPVKEVIQAGIPTDRSEYLEVLRELDTKLSDLYEVSIPVITCWVRDYSYVPETGEIYLTEPNLEEFLHQYRHHLQNVERKYERRGLTTEGNSKLAKVPYEDCMYLLRGEDDARAWSRFIMESADSLVE